MRRPPNPHRVSFQLSFQLGFQLGDNKCNWFSSGGARNGLRDLLITNSMTWRADKEKAERKSRLSRNAEGHDAEQQNHGSDH
jgi:hypothetical protein